MLRDIFEFLKGMFKWWIIVTPWEQGIRVRLGNKVKLLHAGVHMRIPIIDRVFVQTTRQRYCTIPTQTMSTADGKVITISGAIGYSIKDILTLYQTVHHPEEVMQGEAQKLITAYIVERTLAECDAEELLEWLKDEVNFGRYGLNNVKVVITDFVALPKAYRLLTGEPNNWTTGDILDTHAETV